jgi:hypothetical protein
MKRLLQVLGTALALWLAAAAVVSLLRAGAWGPTLAVSALALAVALVPALLALLLDQRLERRSAEAQVVGAMVGVGLRLLLTLALAAAADQLLLPRVVAGPGASGGFLLWVVFFYLATLALTTMYRISVSTDRATSPSRRPEDPGAQHPSHGA